MSNLNAYEEDASRLRAYAAVAKQRALSEDEQRAVDEIGRRLDAEAQSLASDDVAAIQEREGGLRVLSAERGTIANAAVMAATAAEEAEQQRREAVHDAKEAEGDVAHFQALSYGLPGQIAILEDEIKQNYPATRHKHKAVRKVKVDKELAKLRAEKFGLDNAELAAILAQQRFEQLADDAKN